MRSHVDRNLHGLRILYLSHEIPVPPDNGDRIYTLNVLRELAEHGHYVHLVAFGRSRENVAESPGRSTPRGGADDAVFPHASRVTRVPFVAKTPCRAFFSLRPGMVANRRSRRYIQTVHTMLRREEPFDAVLVNHFKMAYLVEAIKPYVGNAVTVLVTQNAEAHLSNTVYSYQKNPIKKFAYHLDWLKMKRYEPRFLQQYDRVTAICREDYEFFTGEYGLRDVGVLTPGVNLWEYRAESADVASNRAAIVCGSFLWEPKKLNLLYFLNCKKFRLLHKKGITLFIIGNANPSLVERVNSTYPGVHMTGRVPDVREYYRRCSIALIPELMGGGFKLKLLEAAAMRKAIVGLKGAVTAPGFEVGTHYLEAGSFDNLVEKTVRLIAMPEEIQRLTRNAYELIGKHYAWSNSYGVLMKVIESGRKEKTAGCGALAGTPDE